MPEWVVWLGASLIPLLIAGGAFSAFLVGYPLLDAVYGWSKKADALHRVLAALVIVAVCCAVGAIYGWRSDTMGNDPWVGVIHGLLGACLAVPLWPKLRARLDKEIETRNIPR